MLMCYEFFGLLLKIDLVTLHYWNSVIYYLSTQQHIYNT